MSMPDLNDFIGVWRAEMGPPYSTHTFKWEQAGAGLRGRWLIEAGGSAAQRAAARPGGPTRLEMEVGDPWLEEGLLLFHVNDGPIVFEFTLVGQNEALVGPAVSKLPPDFTGPDFEEPIEGHRVRLTRQPDAAAGAR
jgi:hypothetical protein